MANFPLMDSPIPTMYITLAYAAFVYYGPRLMKDAKPFKLTGILKVYNFLVCILSGYLVYEVGLILFISHLIIFRIANSFIILIHKSY